MNVKGYKCARTALYIQQIMCASCNSVLYCAQLHWKLLKTRVRVLVSWCDAGEADSHCSVCVKSVMYVGMCTVNTCTICYIYIVKLNVIQLVAGGSSKVRADLFPADYIFSCHKDGVEKKNSFSFSVVYYFFFISLLKREKLMGSFTKYLHWDLMLQEIRHTAEAIKGCQTSGWWTVY